MLSCKEIAERSSALIDGELSAWNALQIRVHLAMCNGCSRFIAQMRMTDQLTAQVARIDEPLQHEAEDGRFAEILSMLRKDQPRR